jgi:hypothetical protein
MGYRSDLFCFACQRRCGSPFFIFHFSFFIFHSILDPRLLVQKMQQPRWAHHQKLDVFEERGLLAFNFVADKLANPGHHKNDQSGLPKRHIHVLLQPYVTDDAKRSEQ